MKNQYVGDIGDFGKVLILKHLAGLGFKIGINWVLTKNDNRADGKHRDYIDYREKDCLCCCDGEIFESILPLVKREKEDRKIEDLESIIRGFSKKTVFYSEYFDGIVSRIIRDRDAFNKLTQSVANLVFFDPDNGIDGEEGTSSKHVFLSDLKRYWKRKQSLLTYHHLSRQDTHEEQIAKLKHDFKKAFPDGRVYTYHLRRGTARVYVLCIREEHLHKIVGKDSISAIEPLKMTKKVWAKRGRCCEKNHSPMPTPAIQHSPLASAKVFDAELFIQGHNMKAGKNPTTSIGYVNRNGQVVIRNTGSPGTDHGQSIYQLGCSHCGYVYGANGADIHLRKCPNCQDGKPGLPIE